jgi:hypothetical protein
MATQEVMVFDNLDPIEIKVTVGNKTYFLKEASGDAACKFDNARSATYEYNEGKLTKVHNPGDLEPLLVSLCLFDGDGNPVPEADIRKWPARIQSKLYDKAREISLIDVPITETELVGQITKLQKQLTVLRKKGDPLGN